MAKRYFEYAYFKENYGEVKNGFKPLGTMGAHKVVSVEKRGDSFLVRTNAADHNTALVRVGQILAYDKGEIFARTPSKLGQFKIKIERSYGDFHDCCEVNMTGNRRNWISIAGISPDTDPQWSREETSYEDWRMDNVRASKPGLYFVEEGTWDGKVKSKFVIVGNYKVTDADITLAEKLLNKAS